MKTAPLIVAEIQGTSVYDQARDLFAEWQVVMAAPRAR
jgi:hypothetical protein